MLSKLFLTFMFLLSVCSWYLAVFQTEHYIRFLSRNNFEQLARLNVASVRWVMPVFIMLFFYCMLGAWGLFHLPFLVGGH